jgi:NAD(P)-dependent dehydrogenase (short-subunit alcohol dehydrogenase family)
MSIDVSNDEKVAIITGASQGIGAVLTKAFHVAASTACADT